MSDFFSATARYMANNSDNYSYESAKSDLYRNVETLRNHNAPFIVFGDWVLVMMTDDDVEDFYLSKKVSSYSIFPEEGVVRSYAHAGGVDLPSILDSDDDI